MPPKTSKTKKEKTIEFNEEFNEDSSSVIPIIVESPSKIKKIISILNTNKGKCKYIVLASCGHFRELSSSYPKGCVGRHDTYGGMGFTIENDKLIVEYTDDPKKKSIITNLKSKCKSAKTIYLATDPDREGEAIAWHIMELLNNTKGPKKDFYRIKFNSITKNDILNALANPTRIDMNLVYAQQTRTIIDKFIGFKVSPLCWSLSTKGREETATRPKGVGWTNVIKAKSAGRVQSPALKLIVDRERAISEFISEEYFSINGIFNYFEHGLHSNSSLIIPQVLKEIPDVPDDYKEIPLTTYNELKGNPITFKTEEDAMKVIEDIHMCSKSNKWIFGVTENESKIYSPPPYNTLSILQDCSNILKIKPENTMKMLQKMYESGWITYHRTDSVALSTEGLFETRKAVEEYHPNLLLEKPRNFTNSKNINAQEAHEAIRPTHLQIRDLKVYLDCEGLDPRIFKIYNMIYLRTIATQCIPQINTVYTINISLSDYNIIFSKSFSILKDLGWKALYPKSKTKSSDTLDKTAYSPEARLSPEGDSRTGPGRAKGKEFDWRGMGGKPSFILKELDVSLNEYQLESHFTKPPPYYTTSSLIKELEGLGIGRPSTYASIMEKLFNNHYITEEESKLHPNEIGIILVDFLNSKYDKHFMNLEYTKNMEKILDGIARGCGNSWDKCVIEFIKEFPS
jgi:DNA topoisomerase-1